MATITSRESVSRGTILGLCVPSIGEWITKRWNLGDHYTGFDASRFYRTCYNDLQDEWFACNYMQTSMFYIWISISERSGERSGVFDSYLD